MKNVLLLTLLFVGNILTGQLKSPNDFLPTKYGEAMTPHHEVVAYVNYVAANSNRVKMIEYGRTNEDRPLILLFISTPENLANLEDIRQTNLYNIGFQKEAPKTKNEKVITWLGFNVHGNENAGTESSMKVIHQLTDPNNSQTAALLANNIVIIDPCLNPDGYARYTHWSRAISGKNIHPTMSDIEHMEPWPGGRTNHYFFDLNRDWAWQAQVETQQRMKIYNQWMPHVHGDFHEMGYNSHYYFAPAAKPYHEYITEFQRSFQVEMGLNHAKYFDKDGWLYFTKENYDLLCPTYGDTYPIFNGAIGMTFEKGGSGTAGRAIIMNNGDTLSLKDRLDQHAVAAMSTIEVASRSQDLLLKNFKAYFEQGRKSPRGKFRTYIVKQSPKVKALQDLLIKNGIQYTFADKAQTASGYNYYNTKTESFNIEVGDVIISFDQPKSILTQVLFEPEAKVEDSLTYDITSWALPYAYGVQTYGLTNDLRGSDKTPNSAMPSVPVSNAYAFIIPWNKVASATQIGKLHLKGIKMRMAKKDAAFGDTKIAKGSVVITRGDNPNVNDFAKSIAFMIDDMSEVAVVSTGFASSGGDLGGENYSLIKAPRVLTLLGDGTSSNEVGAIWNYFENKLKYPISRVDVNRISRVNLDDYNTLVLPDGGYNLDKKFMETLSSWVSKGGKVISIGSANDNFADKEGYSLKEFTDEDEKVAAEKQKKEKDLEDRFNIYEHQDRNSLSNDVIGAIIKNKVDASHPLSFGLGSEYFSLKNGGQSYKLITNAWNVISIPQNYQSHGFIGAQLHKKLEGTVSYAVEDKGRGTIIYMIDSPLFRGFWENGNLLFANALFLVGN